MEWQHQHRVRTGDEPTHARSPLRMRLVLACLGLVNGLLGVGIFGFWLRTLPFLVFFALVAVFSLGNIVVVSVRIRQGAHYQPGPDVPPYRPVDPEPYRPKPPKPITEHRRHLRYLLIMGSCLLLIVLAWTWVRYYSVFAAGVMSVVAALLSPLAAVITNGDSPILREDDSGPPDEWFGDGPPPEWFDHPDENPPDADSSRD
ncbi:DUF6343 family protein [Actinospica sp.]|uniref:DUF6343 family protein n=1 Tax=Actinospica sp. TaxID=1872142 RepID=UPI002C929E1A|nr:DUF6343 family protein [Actinospica sp.]HWG24325.1 DUF6343 family protein [Actinospica sp.]